MGSGNSIIEECELEGDYVEIRDWRLSNGTWRKCGSSTQTPVKITIFQRKLTNSSKRDAEFYENATRVMYISVKNKNYNIDFRGCPNFSRRIREV